MCSNEWAFVLVNKDWVFYVRHLFRAAWLQLYIWCATVQTSYDNSSMDIAYKHTSRSWTANTYTYLLCSNKRWNDGPRLFYIYICVCVCVREREWERERVCVWVCVCACVCINLVVKTKFSLKIKHDPFPLENCIKWM